MPAELSTYWEKRDFTKTREPKGRVHARPKGPPRFVVQEHHARRLHYDLRLEIEGVLKSWAVPKGPSVDPGDKRLAIQTEDHPLEYASFEGEIPKGEYGGGVMSIWDEGEVEFEGDPADMLMRGRLDFALRGDRLDGRFRLLRTLRGSGRQASWLLMKLPDDDLRAPPAAGGGAKETRARAKAGAKKKPAAKKKRASPVARKAVAKVRADGLEEARDDVVAGVVISSPDRVLYPKTGTTKLALARYVDEMADEILPHVADRPLTLVRCPKGHGGKCFYQKNAAGELPPGLEVLDVKMRNHTMHAFIVRDRRGLASLVQMGTLELHPWGSVPGDPERPDRITFDLDPAPDLSFADVIEAAKDVRRRLADLDLDSFVKTTGGKGLHVVVPLAGLDDWDAVHDFSRAFAYGMGRDAPDRYLAKASKEARAGRIFVDWIRNGRGATAIAPYSPRARDGAPVSMPLSWRALRADLDPTVFTIESAPARTRRRADPWSGFFEARQRVPRGVGGYT